jgi:Ser/Thr protein kinase RdoA (MazF antagonist)
VVHDEALATVFSVFPFDRKLRALRRLTDGSWPPISGAAFATCHLVAYAPEKAATAAALDDEGRTCAFVKLYADATAIRTVAVHRALRADGVHVPAVLKTWPTLHAVAFEAVHGTRLAALDGVDGWHALGAALARLHRLDPVDARRSTRLEPDTLRTAAATIAALRPDLGATAWRLERALRSSVPARPGPTVCLHGDVQPKNVLVHPGGASLVDLDDAAGGTAAIDLGSALAGLRYDGLLGRPRLGCAEALVEGYRQEAPPPDRDAVRWCTAAALLGERALRSITRLRPAGLERLEAVLTAGLEELE